MKKLQYSPDALEKLHEIKQDITVRYGEEKAKSAIQEMTKTFWDLQQFESKGPSVENLIGSVNIFEGDKIRESYKIYEDDRWSYNNYIYQGDNLSRINVCIQDIYGERREW